MLITGKLSGKCLAVGIVCRARGGTRGLTQNLRDNPCPTREYLHPELAGRFSCSLSVFQQTVLKVIWHFYIWVRVSRCAHLWTLQR